MTTATPSADPLPLRGCKGVEIFTTRGLPGLYSADDMRQVVSNFYKLGPHALDLHTPPLGIGHDDGQDVLTGLLGSDPRLQVYLGAASLDGDDAPAAGWVTGLKAVPDPDDPAETMLVGDVADIPGPVADLIDARAYKQVSAEIYDDFPAAGRTFGKVLRRVALCGWQPPQNKALADVPATVAQYAEPRRLQATDRRASTRPGAYLCFSEMTAMTKAQMLATLKAKKVEFSDAAAAAMSDAEVKLIFKKFTEDPAPTSPPPPAPVVKMDEPPGRDQMIAEMQAGGADAAQLAALDDQTLATMYAQWKAQNPAPAAPAAQVAAMAELKKYTEEAKQLVTTLNIETAKAKTYGASAKAHADAVKKYAEDTVKTAKAQKIAAARLDLCGATGVAYCTPAEFAAIHGPTLEEKDDVTIRTFSENGKAVDRTPFADYIARLKALPPKKTFGEKLPAEPFGSGGDPAAVKQAERAKVQAFAESNADQIKLFGYTPAAYVAKFEKLQEKLPDLTAEKFIAGA